MNIMFYDRQFLIVPHPADQTKNLVERLIMGNSMRNNPYDLTTIIDKRTLGNYYEPAPDESELKAKKGWAFYIPSKECPLDYRELSLWFMLFSLHRARKLTSPYFQNSFAGLEKLLGLGQRQAVILADRLVARDLIMVDRSRTLPWFYLHDPTPFEHWFRPSSDNSIPAQFLQAEENKKIAGQSDQPSDYEFIMCNPAIHFGKYKTYQERKNYYDNRPSDYEAVINDDRPPFFAKTYEAKKDWLEKYIPIDVQEKIANITLSDQQPSLSDNESSEFQKKLREMSNDE